MNFYLGLHVYLLSFSPIFILRSLAAAGSWKEEGNFSIQLFTSAGLLASMRDENWISIPKSDLAGCAWCYLLGLYLGDAAAVRGEKKSTMRRVCDRGATEIPRQSYSSSRPDVTLLSTPFGTVGSLVRGIIQHAGNPKRGRGGEGDLPPLRLREEEKSDFSYMPIPERSSTRTTVTHFPRQ